VGSPAGPGCQNGHKNLGNASKAMTGFTLVQHGSHFLSSRAYAGTLQFYLGSLEAPRAEGPATLAWLGKTISEQPEFNSCVVTKVLNYLYDGYDYSPDLKEQLEALFAVRQDFASMFESAVIARYLAVPPNAQAAAQ